jgi:hypothetical protein
VQDRRVIVGLVAWVSLLGLALPGCDDTHACKSKPECIRQGQCAVSEKGACVATSDEDCAGSEACKLHGKCAAVSNACVAKTDAGCQASDDCKKLGACDAYQGACANLAQSVHAECTKTCLTEGRCVMKAGQCAALSVRHCAGTSDDKPEADSACATLGHCTPQAGVCVASTDQDCKKSVVCKDAAQCAAKDGNCVAVEKDCAASKACSADGKCGAAAGKCVALNNASCRSSSRCKLDGACTAKDGACVIASSADCAQASVCTQAKHCLFKDGACTSSGGGKGDATASGAPDKAGPTTIQGLF